MEVVPLGEANKAPIPACPEGTQWAGSECVSKRVVTQVECPAGSSWDGSKCTASVDTNCAAGLHFVPARGCVANQAAAPEVPSPKRTGDFDRGAARTTLVSIAGNVQDCKKSGDSGPGRVMVTFAPSGAVQSAVVSGPPFEGTPTGACVSARFRAARIPAFSGSPVSVSKTFTIE